MHHLAIAAVLAGAAGFAATEVPAAAPAAVEARVQEDFRWSGRLAAGREIRVMGISGGVRAEHTSGDRVEVVGRRRGADASQVRIEAVETEDGVVICAIYPGSGSRGRNTGPCPSGGGDGRTRVRDARVDFTVRVPAGVHFAAMVVDGDVHAEGLRSPVDVATVSGDVRVSTTSTARAATVSGDIHATFGTSDGRQMAFNTVSGDVVLRLGSGVGADVRAQTLSGDITTDFDLRRRPMAGGDERGRGWVNVEIGRSATGTIGRGGAELSINTVSGDIRILRAR
jgi:hypothetical protein